ncbi:MAG TPA: hypothetical protein VFE87_02185 [Candidatus Paceibacterota bacterium]|nr:hypothetical protein [Candidatus Paceibacterota bacterium]
MAILIEEEKNNNPVFTAAVVGAAVIILSLGTYFVFFKTPPGIEKATVSTEMQSVAQVSKVSLDVEVSNITDSPVYKSLKQQVSPPSSTLFGRQNPYAPF